MAGRLTIRRVGNFLPSMCLAGVLLVVAIITWLCTVGLPDCALRYLEQEAAKAGVQLTIDKIRLSPSSGMAAKAEDVVITLPQEDAPPATLSIRKAQVAFSIARMLTGQFRPHNIRVVDGALSLPLSEQEEDKLELHGIDLYTVFLANGKGIVSTLKANLHHAALETKLVLTDTEAALQLLQPAEKDSTEATQSPAELLADVRSRLAEVKTQLALQHWDNAVHPHLRLNIIQEKTWKIELAADIPNYEWKQFHFRDARLSASIENRVITIEHLSFKTVDPDTSVTLQAGYDWVAGDLEFSAKSTAPILKIVRAQLDLPEHAILNKIQAAPENTPTLELSGSANLAENYALNKISMRGKLEHRELMLGNTPVNHLLVSFYMLDGRFNLDTVRLTLNDGYISATAGMGNGKGHAELDISLPDEVMLALARDFSDNDALTLPEGLIFEENLVIRIKGDMQVPLFEPGKTHLEDLIPTLHSCSVQFNTGKTHFAGAIVDAPALSLQAEGIDYAGADIKVAGIKLDAKLGDADHREQNAAAADLLVNIKLDSLELREDLSRLGIQQADLRVSATSARSGDTRLQKLHTTSGLNKLEVNLDDVVGSLRSSAISAKLYAESFTHADTTANGIYLDLSIPKGLYLADAWKNMQKDTDLKAEVFEILGKNEFRASNTKFILRHIAENTISLDFRSKVGEEDVTLHGTAALLDNKLVKLDSINLHLPAAAFKPLLGGEPLAELKLPGLVDAQGDALIDTESGALLNSHFQVHIPELVRVCQNVHVHKGMEIPLALDVKGEFTTAADGSMSYAADVQAVHKAGELNVHVSGDPLKECRITGSNTITVDVINALIDNADAHWIMRDFRCTPGLTRNVINNIDTTIRYDKGVYVHALCDAELYDMDFQLGALRDVEDAEGNPTGEEYLRTDLGNDPYTRVKVGKCGVDVLVRLDCVDEQGNALPDRTDIHLNNPDLLYDNKPWLKRMGYKTGAATSRITGEAIRFDIEACTISLHKLKGTCYPAYSIGMYYAPLQHFLADVDLRDPARIETDYCIFPISRSCKVPMQGLIHAEADKNAGFKFLGTTIPLQNFSGFINISDVDVYLDRMNAQCWGGSMNGALRIGFAGEHTTLDGYFVASNMNLKDIVASYGEKFTPATCNGYIRFQAAEPTLEAVRAYGQVHLTDGDLMQIGLFRPIGALLADMPGNLAKLQESVHLKKEEAPPSWADEVIRAVFDTGSNAIDSVQDSAYKVPFANHFLRYGIDEASAKFDINNGHLISRDMRARGYNLDVGMQLDINLDGLTLTGDLWPRISSVPTMLISPITILSNFLIDINLYGDLLSPQWEFGLSKKLKREDNSLSPEPQKK